MSLPEPSFKDVDPMMRHLEAAIDNNTATPKLLGVMQRRLDIIDEQHRDDPDVADGYHKLLELQALIYGTQRNDAQATKFMKGAVEMAGGADKLSSRLLRKYIREHQQGQAANRPAAHQAHADAPAKPHHGEGMQLFAMPLWRLVILSIFTVGLYDFYWFYRNWKFIKQHEDSNIWPFWRAVFTVIWIWPLFSRIRKSARRQGDDTGFSPFLAAFLFLLLTIGYNGIGHVPGDRMAHAVGALAVLVVSVVPLLPVQRAINFNNAQLSKKKIKRTAPEIILIIIGLLLFAAFVATLFVPLDKIEDKVNPTQQRVAVQQQKLESLTAQYNACASELKARAKTIDKNDPDAVDKYNDDITKCDAVREQQNQAVDTYDALIARKN